MDGAQHFILIEPGADGLPDLGEQFVLLSAAMCVVRDHVVIDGESELQCEPDHKARTGGPEGSALRVRKKNYTEGVIAGLQTHGGQIANFALP